MKSVLDSGKFVGPIASVKQVARKCGLPFPVSLTNLLATPGCPFSRWNRVHIKVLSAPTLPIGTMLSGMRQVYATGDIGVQVVSRETLTGSAFIALLDVSVVPNCPLGSTTAQQNQLFQNRNNVGVNEIVVYFVRSTLPVNNGCASHPPGQDGAVVAQIASRWTVAHEVGHVLGLAHIAGENPPACTIRDSTRLMTGCSTDRITGVPVIVQGEIDTMRGSNLTRPG